MATNADLVKLATLAADVAGGKFVLGLPILYVQDKALAEALAGDSDASDDDFRRGFAAAVHGQEWQHIDEGERMKRCFGMGFDAGMQWLDQEAGS